MIKLGFGHTGLFRCVMSGKGDYIGRNLGCSSEMKPEYIHSYSEISGIEKEIGKLSIRSGCYRVSDDIAPIIPLSRISP